MWLVNVTYLVDTKIKHWFRNNRDSFKKKTSSWELFKTQSYFKLFAAKKLCESSSYYPPANWVVREKLLGWIMPCMGVLFNNIQPWVLDREILYWSQEEIHIFQCHLKISIRKVPINYLDLKPHCLQLLIKLT